MAQSSALATCKETRTGDHKAVLSGELPRPAALLQLPG